MEEGENDNDVLHVAALQLSGLHFDDVLQKQSEDQEWKCLIEAKKSNSRPTPLPDQDGKSMEIRRLWQLWDQLVLKEGLLYRKFFDCKHSAAVTHQLVVPLSLRQRVLKEVQRSA